MAGHRAPVLAAGAGRGAVGGLLRLGRALGAVAGARRTATAYGRYLTSIRASDVFANVPGRLPAEPVLRPIRLISQLPGVSPAPLTSC